MRAALVDLDGTVTRGAELVPGADEGIRALREAGLEVVFLTNNPTRSPGALADRLAALGVPVEPEAVVTSAVATRRYLDEHYAGARALAVAGDTVVDQLRGADVTFVADPGDVDLVVAGYDEGFDYGDLTAGLRALLGGADLVGTDPDRWVPTEEGPIPGSGAVVNAVAGAAEVEPTAVLGKPSRETVELALEHLGVPAERCLLVGDRLETDVRMGAEAGMTTALVMTGVADDAALATAEVQPDHVLDSLADVEGLL